MLDDIFARAVDYPLDKPVDFLWDDEDYWDVHFWPKHRHLYFWMQNLYVWKGGDLRICRCINVVLDTEDLDRLEAAIRTKTMSHAAGNFLDNSYGPEAPDDLAFVAKAREAIADGWTVFVSARG